MDVPLHTLSILSWTWAIQYTPVVDLRVISVYLHQFGQSHQWQTHPRWLLAVPQLMEWSALKKAKKVGLESQIPIIEIQNPKILDLKVEKSPDFYPLAIFKPPRSQLTRKSQNPRSFFKNPKSQKKSPPLYLINGCFNSLLYFGLDSVSLVRQ